MKLTAVVPELGHGRVPPRPQSYMSHNCETPVSSSSWPSSGFQRLLTGLACVKDRKNTFCKLYIKCFFCFSHTKNLPFKTKLRLLPNQQERTHKKFLNLKMPHLQFCCMLDKPKVDTTAALWGEMILLLIMPVCLNTKIILSSLQLYFLTCK